MRARKLLFGEIPHLTAAPPNAQVWKVVDQLSQKIQPMNCGLCPTSLISKLAFSCCPSAFVPYDRLGRGQLRTAEHNYLAYREKFAQKQANVEQQKLCAWVCLRDDEAASIEEIREEIRTFCQGQIAHYKIPRYVKFVDGFPMTVTGKIQKFLMRQQMIDELGLACRRPPDDQDRLGRDPYDFDAPAATGVDRT